MRFTTRDWMWLMVVFGLAYGWGMHYYATRSSDADAARVENRLNVVVADMNKEMRDLEAKNWSLRKENAKLRGQDLQDSPIP